MKTKLQTVYHGFIVLIMFLTVGCDRPWTGSIRGTITDSETEAGIPGVFVRAKSLKNGYAVSSMSDELGNYRLHDVRWGPNIVQIYHPHYSSVEKYGDVIRDSSIEVDFSVSERTLYMDTSLFIDVINANGDPVNQAVIDLYQFKENIYEYYFFLETKTTDESGNVEFTLPRIYEDEIIEFQIRIAALGYHDQIRDFVVTWGSEDPELRITMEFVE